MKSKKGQITIFILIGVFIALGVTVYFFVSGGEDKKQEAEGFIEEITSEDAKTLKLYVEKCLDEKLSDSVLLVGQQGGFIYTDEYEDQTIEPENPDAFSMFERELVMPFWYYQTERGDIKNIPALRQRSEDDDSIEDQLSRHIEQTLPNCINQFAEFNKQGMSISEQSAPNAQVTVNENDIMVQLTYPITIDSQASGVSTISKFTAKKIIDLYSIYELANSIASFEINTNMFETSSINLISGATGLDNSLLPPISASSEFGECSDKIIWSVSNIRPIAETTLSYMRYIKINNTQMETLTSDEQNDLYNRLEQNVFDSLIYDIASDPATDMKVTIQKYPLNSFSVNDNSAGIIEPESEITIPIPFAEKCLFDYYARYSFKYPVLITIQDTTPNQEYLFQFPMQIVVKNNMPRFSTPKPISNVTFPIPSDLENMPSNDCDKNLRTSGQVNIQVSNKVNPVEKVNKAKISYQCGLFGDRCRMGYTDEQGNLNINFPNCIGGAIFIENEDYLGTVELFDPPQAGEVNVSYQITKLKEFNVQFKKHTLTALTERQFNELKQNQDEGWLQDTLDSGYDIYESLNPLEQYVLGPFREKITDELEDMFTEEGNYTVNFPLCTIDTTQVFAVTEDEDMLVRPARVEGLQTIQPQTVNGANRNFTLKLAPGQYQIDVMLFLNKDTVIPRGAQTYEADDETIYIPGEDKEIKGPLITGGLIHTFNISNEDFLTKENITFFLLDDGEPNNIMEIGESLSNYQKCSTTLKDELQIKLS